MVRRVGAVYDARLRRLLLGALLTHRLHRGARALGRGGIRAGVCIRCRRLRRGVLPTTGGRRRLWSERGRNRPALGRIRINTMFSCSNQRIGLGRPLRVLAVLTHVALRGRIEQAFLHVAEQLPRLHDRLVCHGKIIKAGLVPERKTRVMEARLLEIVVHEQVHFGRREQRRYSVCSHDVHPMYVHVL